MQLTDLKITAMNSPAMSPAVFALFLFALAASCTVEKSTTPAQQAPATSSSEVWFGGSFDEGVAQARATQKLVFVDFFTTWCPPCKKLDKDTFSAAEVKAELAKMVSIKIDAESPAGVPVAKKYRVGAYPTLLVTDGKGLEVGRLVGFHTPDQLLAKLAEFRARPAR